MTPRRPISQRSLFTSSAATLLLAFAIPAFALSSQPHPAENVRPSALAPTAFAELARSTSPMHWSVDTAATDDATTTDSSSSLPEDPSALQSKSAPLQASALPATPTGTTKPFAPKYTKYVPSWELGQPITARDKVIIGARDLVSPFTFLGDITSALYSHATNGEPNYGTNLGAFGQQLGATVLRDATEGVFTDMVFSPMLHEDPRYFVEGPQYGFFHRVVYSITRPLITRSDSGKNTLNAALLLGYAGSSALTYTYYPKINQNFHDTASTYGGSIGGAAIGDLVSEFADQFLQAIHLEKKP